MSSSPYPPSDLDARPVRPEDQVDPPVEGARVDPRPAPITSVPEATAAWLAGDRDGCLRTGMPQGGEGAGKEHIVVAITQPVAFGRVLQDAALCGQNARHL